jgi:hypothetical protein
MQITFPRFAGQALVNFCRQVGDILDIKSITIDDKTDGKAGFGMGEIMVPKFTFEAHDGATATIEPALGADLNPLLSARFVAAELERARSQAKAEAPAPPETRPFTRDEALRLLDRLRNEVGAMKARFAIDFIPAEDTEVHCEFRFNDGSEIAMSIPNIAPLTPDKVSDLIFQARELKRMRTIPGGTNGTAAAAAKRPPDQEPQPQS